MLKYKDVYDRPVFKGDIVLCAYYASYEPECVRTLINDTFMCVGSEDIYFISPAANADIEIVCYKIEDTEMKELTSGFNYLEWSKRYNNAKVHISPTATARSCISMVEMLGREIKAGDLVLYDLANTRGKYGLVVGNKEILTETGFVQKQNYGLLIKQPSAYEQRVKADLMAKYIAVCQTRVTTKTLKFMKDVTPGEVYLTKDNKYICIYVATAAYSIKFKSVGKSTVSDFYDRFYIQMPVSMKSAKEFMEKLNSGARVDLKTVMGYLTFMDTVQIYAVWDTALMDKLIKCHCGVLDYRSESLDVDINSQGTPVLSFDGWYDYIPASIAMQVFKGWYDNVRVKPVRADKVKLKRGASYIGQISLNNKLVLLDNDYLEIVMYIK